MHRAVHAAYPVERISIEYGFFISGIRPDNGYCKPDVRFGRSSKRSDIRPYRIPLQFSFLNRGQKLSASVLENANVHCGVTFIRDNMI